MHKDLGQDQITSLTCHLGRDLNLGRKSPGITMKCLDILVENRPVGMRVACTKPFRGELRDNYMRKYVHPCLLWLI
jgi:hypothetical protein